MPTQTSSHASLHADSLKSLEKVAAAIRTLSIDGVEKADSGHPGLPLGCAEIGSYLYGYFLIHNPKDPHWPNRDRFILSAGHGSMFLYSCLHLAGFDLKLDELKRFRQLHSKTPGHPEFEETPGVETTTGPLGQGLAAAVGQALGLKMLGARFNTEAHCLFDSKVISLAGDGCFMEGISHEASALAGHLKLNNLIYIYDSNGICLDGPVSECWTEDTKKRYEAYGFDCYCIDGHKVEELNTILQSLRLKQEKPVLIIAKTIIGKGSPNKAGTHKVHGAPLGREEVIATKKALGLPEEEFFVHGDVRSYFAKKLEKDLGSYAKWKERFLSWQKAHPELAKEFDAMQKQTLPSDIEAKLHALKIDGSQSGRKASNMVINALCSFLPQIVGGSADLSCSDNTTIKDGGTLSAKDYKAKNIKYGVREFGMAACATGIAQTGFFTPFVGTFFTFSDYMRNAVRLAAIQKVRVIYQFTHDSVLLGEDGPTHQPIEHLASLRAMPNLLVLRPGDQHEVKMSWLAALMHKGPCAIVLTRQNNPELKGTKVPYKDGVGRGAYIVKKESKGPAAFCLFATGSELSLAVDVAAELEKRSKATRVVSVPSWELFAAQDAVYKKTIVGENCGKRVSIEAATSFGWERFIGLDGTAIAIDRFGLSAKQNDIAEELGFTVESILKRLL